MLKKYVLKVWLTDAYSTIKQGIRTILNSEGKYKSLLSLYSKEVHKIKYTG